MTRNQIARITTGRLQGWARGVIDAHATPVLLVAVGHDEAEGRIEVFTMEGMPDGVVYGFLLAVLERFKASIPVEGQTGKEPQNHTS